MILVDQCPGDRFAVAARLDREVAHYKVAAMELPGFLDHLEEGSLVVAPGDRSDIMIGTLVADAISILGSVDLVIPEIDR